MTLGPFAQRSRKEWLGTPESSEVTCWVLAQLGCSFLVWGSRELMLVDSPFFTWD